MEVILSKDVNELEMTKVARLFKCGLKSLNSAVTNVTSTKSTSINTLKQNVKVFYSKFKEAATEAKLVKNSFSAQLLQLVEKKSAIENNLREKEREKENLKIKLRAHKSQLSDLEDELQSAEEDVKKSEEAQEHAEKQLEEKKVEQNATLGVGIATSFIPFVGWVAGPALIAVSLTALEKNKKAAEDYLDEARRRLQDREKRVEERKSSITDQEKKIKTVSETLDQCRKEKQRNEENLQTTEKKFKRQSEICKQLEDAVIYLEKTAGRSGMVYHEIKFFYDLKPLLEPMKSLALHLVPGLSLHPALLEDSAFQNFHLRLKALEKSSENEIKNLQLTFKDRETMEIQLLEHLRCESFLVPAPMALALLGQVCTLSLKHDFLLDDSRPKDGFKFLKSNSFRANLQEITYLVWSAFGTAHVNMDQIHGFTKTLPIHLSNALHMLEDDTDADFEYRFRNCLKIISSTSDRCLFLSKEAEGAFIKIIETLMELQESCTSCKGKQEKQLIENKKNMKQSQEIKENIDDQRRIHTERLTKLREKAQETEKQYQNSVQLPGFWEAVGVGAAGLFNKALSALSKPATETKTNGKKMKEMKGGKLSFEELRSYEIAKTLLREIQTLNNLYVKDGTLDKHVLESCNKMIAIRSKVSHEESRLQNMSGNSVQQNLLGICQKVKEICQFLQDFKYHMNNDDQRDERWKTAKDMKSLEIQLQEITEQGEKDNAYKTHHTNNPVKVPCKEETENEDLMDYTIHRHTMKSEAYLQQLENLQHRYDKEASDLKENNEQLAKILGEMSSLKMENIDFEATLDVFQKSLRSLAEIREQWGKVVQYFQSVVAIIDCSLNVSLQKFSKYAEGRTQESTLTKLKLNMMRDQVLTAKQFLAGLNHVSETYTEVSEEFLLPTTKNLQGILGLTKSDSLIEAELKLFETRCSECQKDIEKWLCRRRTTFLSQVKRGVSLHQSLPSRSEVDDFF